jgi:hypothetical protein
VLAALAGVLRFFFYWGLSTNQLSNATFGLHPPTPPTTHRYVIGKEAILTSQPLKALKTPKSK